MLVIRLLVMAMRNTFSTPARHTVKNITIGTSILNTSSHQHGPYICQKASKTHQFTKNPSFSTFSTYLDHRFLIICPDFRPIDGVKDVFDDSQAFVTKALMSFVQRSYFYEFYKSLM